NSGAPPRRKAQYSFHVGRDRQDRRRFTGRSGERVARSARSAPEQYFRRSLFGRAVRSLADHFYRDRELPRRRARTDARPDGSDFVAGLHRAREIGNRETLFGPATDGRKWIEA